MASGFSMFFFVALMLIAFLGFVFSIMVYRHTRGAMRGWLYLSVYGMANATLGILGMVRNVVTGDLLQVVFFLQAICIMTIFSFAILSATAFPKQFNLDHKLLSGRNILIFVWTILLGVFIFNVTSFTSLWAQRLYSIAILGLCIAYFIILVPMGKLVLHTRKAPWFFLWLGWFFNALLIFSLLGGSCCNAGDILAGEGNEECNEIVFFNILSMECSPGIAGVYQLGLLSVLVGSVFIVLAMGLLWHKLHKIKT